MRETPADTARAFLLAVLLHVGLFLLLVVGLWWTRSAAPAAPGSISAELIDASQLSTEMRRTLSMPPQPIKEEVPEPLPEPVPESQPKPQDFIPLPDDVDQVEVTEEPTPTPAVEEKPQEAKHRQEQVDLTQEQRQQEAQRNERLTEMERQRQKQIEDLRRRRMAATRDRQRQEQTADQLDDVARSAATAAAQSDAASGQGGVDAGLQARYIAAIIAAVESKWVKPDNLPPGARCRVRIIQLKGGQVMRAEVTSPCAYDEQARRSIEAAVLKAQPLPYAGFESVYQRELLPTFEAK